ncbi:helix-turn-helix domain-containing protein [Natronobacterium texcoconense]|uniref:IclR helix-turn-helix domain-containing protein n=1 Tax=Natronobacterium texcoconense TaxID=1095778 RepID=A0A1H1GJ46_NATTX|nr:helix-turn-helix domain-containing protein [Natronobacterium texcoconense]SDR13113.1 IclR helix-turn-helix domain-containing protein [Natronobacterium texcoconense]
MPTDEPPDGKRAHLLEVLLTSSPATIPELAARLETHPATIERRCLALQKDGYVRHCTGGKVVPTDRARTSDSLVRPESGLDTHAASD